MGTRAQIFKTKWMTRYSRHERIADEDLLEAIHRADRGLIDANLGGGLIKQRIARKGRGRSGGYRTIVAYRMGNRAVFLYAFAKNEQENIGPDELAELRELGSIWLNATHEEISEALGSRALEEVNDDEEKGN